MLSASHVVHGALAEEGGCSSCHSPHFSHLPKLQKTAQPESCLKCHDKPLKTKDGSTLTDMVALLKLGAGVNRLALEEQRHLVDFFTKSAAEVLRRYFSHDLVQALIQPADILVPVLCLAAVPDRMFVVRVPPEHMRLQIATRKIKEQQAVVVIVDGVVK